MKSTKKIFLFGLLLISSELNVLFSQVAPIIGLSIAASYAQGKITTFMIEKHSKDISQKVRECDHSIIRGALLGTALAISTQIGSNPMPWKQLIIPTIVTTAAVGSATYAVHLLTFPPKPFTTADFSKLTGIHSSQLKSESSQICINILFSKDLLGLLATTGLICYVGYKRIIKG